jgi:hypothetical protein
MSSTTALPNDSFVRFAARFASACTTGAFAADLRRMRAARIACGLVGDDGAPSRDTAAGADETRAA